MKIDPLMAIIKDSVLMRKNTGQRKLLFTLFLRSVTIYNFSGHRLIL